MHAMFKVCTTYRCSAFWPKSKKITTEVFKFVHLFLYNVCGIAYTGAGAGLISEVLSVQEVFDELIEGTQKVARRLA